MSRAKPNRSTKNLSQLQRALDAQDDWLRGRGGVGAPASPAASNPASPLPRQFAAQSSPAQLTAWLIDEALLWGRQAAAPGPNPAATYIVLVAHRHARGLSRPDQPAMIEGEYSFADAVLGLEELHAGLSARSSSPAPVPAGMPCVVQPATEPDAQPVALMPSQRLTIQTLAGVDAATRGRACGGGRRAAGGENEYRSGQRRWPADASGRVIRTRRNQIAQFSTVLWGTSGARTWRRRKARSGLSRRYVRRCGTRSAAG